MKEQALADHRRPDRFPLVHPDFRGRHLSRPRPEPRTGDRLSDADRPGGRLVSAIPACCCRPACRMRRILRHGRGARRPDREAAVPGGHPPRHRVARLLRPPCARRSTASPTGACCSTSSSAAASPNLPATAFISAHDERYAHADEFFTVFEELLEKGVASYDGKYIKATDARLGFPSVQ